MRQSSHVKVKDSIATHLLSVVFSFYILLTLAVTFAHMTVEFSDTREKVNHELMVIGNTFKSALAQALWDIHLVQLQPTFLGMVKSPDVIGIKLKDEWQRVFGSGRIKNNKGETVDIIKNDKGEIANSIKNNKGEIIDFINHDKKQSVFDFIGLLDDYFPMEYSFPLQHKNKGKFVTVGAATIYSSNKVVFDKVLSGFKLIIINAVIKTLALWFLFLVISRKLLSRPLASLTRAAEQLNLDKLNNLKITIETKGRNELKILEEAFNSMIQKLIGAREEIINQANQLKERNETLSTLSTDLKHSNHRLLTILDNTKALALVSDKKSAMLLIANTVLAEIPFGHFPRINIVYQDTDVYNTDGYISFCPTSIADSINGVMPEVNTMDSDELIFTPTFSEKLALPKDIKTTGHCLTATQLDLIARHGDRLQGMISIQDIDTSVITTEHLAFIDTLAHFLSLTIEKFEIYQGLERKVNERNSKLIAAFQQLANQHAELKATQQQLVQSEKLASIGTLTAGIAHEINNPTNFAYASVYMMQDEISEIKTFLKQLAGGDDADPDVLQAFEDKFAKLIELANTASEGTKRIKVIVGDLRSFTRFEDTKQEDVHLSKLIKSTVNLVSTQYHQINIEPVFISDPMLTCFPAKLSQVFMNVCVNACQAIETSQQINHELSGKLTITLIENTDQIIITFKDNGCGMNEKTQKKIFDPFYTTKDVGSGTGLGMAISFGIIEEHGGSLKVASAIGEGSTISIYLPLKA